MNDGWTYRDQITAATDVGRTALDFYTTRYRHSSAAAWAQRFADGQVQLNGTRATAQARLRCGDLLTWQRPPWHEPDVPCNYTLLYEDHHLLAVDKPAGLPVMPGGGFVTHTLLHLLRQREGDDTITPLHRLGRGTSGVTLFAKTALARRALAAAFRDNTTKSAPLITKTYRALTIPAPPELPDTITINTPIGPILHHRLGTIHAATPDGKPALSHARLLRRDAHATLWEVGLVTGRPHQIRIHLAAINCPLSGDPLFGPGGTPRPAADPDTAALPGDGGYHLHAALLRFTHPATNTPLTITAPLPTALR